MSITQILGEKAILQGALVMHNHSKKLVITLLLVLSLGLTLRLWIALLPVEKLIEKVMVDDGFYFLQIAKNIAAGKGPSFDGKSLTNGFHPIWAFLLSAFDYNSNLNTPINWALILLSIFNTATAYIAFLTVSRLTNDKWIGLFASCFWLFNPIVIITALNGTESALSTLAIALACYYYLGLRSKNEENIRDCIMLGAGLGLAILIRSDSIFLLLAIVLDYLMVQYPGRGLRAAIKGCLAIGLSSFVVFSPWLLWSWLTFGTIRQVSGVVIPYSLHTLFFAQNGYALSKLISHVMGLLLRGVAVIVYMCGPGDLILMPLGQLFLAAVVGSVVITWIRNKQALRRNFQQAGSLNSPFIFIYSGGIFAYYTIYHWYVNFRYFLPLVYISSLFICILLGKLARVILENKQGWRRNVPIIIGTALIFVLFVSSYLVFWGHGRAPHQLQHYQAVTHLNGVLSKDAIIGSWNAGVIGYFYKGRTVNLDGVVNNSILPAIKEGRVMKYILQNNISYLCDSEVTFSELTPFLGKNWSNYAQLAYKIEPIHSQNNLRWSKLKWSQKRMNSPFLIYKVKRTS